MFAKKGSQQKSIICISVGDANVGKSSIFARQFYGEVPQQNSLYVDYSTILVRKGNEEIQFKFWVINHLHKHLTSQYYRTSILIMIYDITSRDSFTHIQYYYEDYVKKCNIKSIIALVGNKKDLNEFRQVSFQEGQDLAKSLGVDFFEVSAFTGDKVKDLYDFLINQSFDTANFE
ncbi:Ras family small GTPase (macronuclear) [Tetrahymena thermophila SB210]|uniref:Ras family small GTPase n=2 Tax=Tetrahymena thermophila TaxID=5911 RepID=Q22NH6_TETTS|nr:Ras family small GTPase [Tetrahymena thermophila SB210]EAR86809.1 Ras family small GTPase [Tetrahymena thermophila SB210]BAJ21324.1 Rab-family small GTPase RabX1G [Tetrahymena thermophila]|eukprot:XP_001007054.1 Ras family small GTPase [Tetrahymena thermophila SB210]